MAKTVTFDPQEPVFEQPALQVVLELLADQARQVTSGTLNLLNQARVVLGNGVEYGLFRAMPAVGKAGDACEWSEHLS